MVTITFHVPGLPPKKDGANSMWGKAVEMRRLVALRTAAWAVVNGPPLRRDIRLSVTVHVGKTNTRATGDLDTFITGICDGLMAAERSFLTWLREHPDAGIAQAWNAEPDPLRPDRAVAIEDDCQVVAITAGKVTGDAEAWYEVTLEGER